MAAARIVHFGIDECNRVLVLAHSGYEVDECGTSVATLMKARQRGKIDAFAFTEDEVQFGGTEAITIARSLSPAPLILFEGIRHNYPPPGFDLVIPNFTPAAEWLKSISEVLQRSRSLCADTRLLCEESSSLRAEAALVRKESVAAREESVIERELSWRQRSRRTQDK